MEATSTIHRVTEMETEMVMPTCLIIKAISQSKESLISHLHRRLQKNNQVAEIQSKQQAAITRALLLLTSS